jgi:ornithine cyclodeaminase/alanine dehydrogenase-like protein (mu-crystallin family)
VIHLETADLVRLGRRGAARAVREFLAAAAAGRTASPPRAVVPVGDRSLVFSVGGDIERQVAGFRLYTLGATGAEGGAPDQLLALLDLRTGAILATAAGAEFGAWRTAAIGAVALEEGLRGREGPVAAAVVGAGFQAGHHARAWAESGRVAEVRVWARRTEAARALADALVSETGIPSRAADDPRRALLGARAVLFATSASAPVLPADAIAPDAYVATLGPKFGGRHEVPAETYATASLFTDAPEQVAAYERSRGPLPAGRRVAETTSLADLVAGRARLPAEGVRLFVSEGLTGTEVALLAAALDARTASSAREPGGRLRPSE